MANNELNLHIAARTAMMHVAVVLTNLGDARNSTLSSEDMALIQARLADLNRAFIETGMLATPAQAEPSDALPDAATVDKHLDTVLRASGSALAHYSMAKTLEAMRTAMLAYAKQAIEARGGALSDADIHDAMSQTVDCEYSQGIAFARAIEARILGQQGGGDAALPAIADPVVANNWAALNEVVLFLMGGAPLEGVIFGERHPTKAGLFWWRLNLRAAMCRAKG